MEMLSPSSLTRSFSILMTSNALILSLLLATQAFLFKIIYSSYSVLENQYST